MLFLLLVLLVDSGDKITRHSYEKQYCQLNTVAILLLLKSKKVSDLSEHSHQSLIDDSNDITKDDIIETRLVDEDKKLQGGQDQTGIIMESQIRERIVPEEDRGDEAVQTCKRKRTFNFNSSTSNNSFPKQFPFTPKISIAELTRMFKDVKPINPTSTSSAK